MSEKTSKPKKNKGKGGTVRALLFVLLAAALCGAAYLAKLGIDELCDRQRGQSFYEELATLRESETDENNTTDFIHDNAVQNMPQQEKKSPKSKIDFDALINNCPDVVAWIKIDGTEIDYPVVRCDDNDFYLSHLADKTENKAGAIMMDCANDGSFNDDVNILHGHHMKNGTMFGRLEDYNTKEYYKEHPIIRLFTPNGDYDVAVFAAYTVNGYSFGYPTSFYDEAEFDLFVRKAVSSTGYETDVEVAFGDRLLLLSTCAYSFDGARYVVIGKIEE